jgi:hypothetical protein
VRVYENRVAEENIWTVENEVTGGWRKLKNKELRNCTLCHNSNNQVRRMRWAGQVAYLREKKNTSRIKET